MTNISDATLVMGPDELRLARELSVARLEPPLHVPGYEQEAFLGKGAFGEAWRAVDSNSGRRVVIKFFNSRGGLDWSLLAREVEKLRHLFSDRHIIQLFAVGWDATPPYYVMDYMQGGSLEHLLRGGPLAMDHALAMFREIAVGLMHAHGKGIIHCDLKPANVLLDQDGSPRLADFGQSRLSHEQGAALGTLFYMAPEQADLRAVPDARWDVYALGAILYHMLTGSIPFRDDPGAEDVLKPGRLEERLDRYRRLLAGAPKPSAHRRVTGVDAALAEVVDRCLAVDPKARFRDVGSVLHALDARATRLAQRPLLLLGVLGPLLVVVVIGAIAFFLVRQFVDQAKTQLIAQAKESNRFAARLLAERLALRVQNRWSVLEAESDDPGLMRLLAAPRDSPEGRDPDGSVRRWIDDRRAYWNHRFSQPTAALDWFAADHHGRLRTLSPYDDALVGRYFGYRDYFHGLGHELKPGDPQPPPITRPHRSNIYMSQGTNTLTVTFSVPVWGPGRTAGAPPIGILAMETQAGHFTEFRGTRDQSSVLIDLRPDANGRTGQIVAHPRLPAMEQRSPGACFYAAPEVVARADRVLRARLAGNHASTTDADEVIDNYVDPLVGSDGGSRFAVLAPVLLMRGRGEVRDSGWVVLVVERRGETLKPLKELEKKILWYSFGTLSLVMIVISGLWAFVLMGLRQGRMSPWLGRWRRWWGLPSLGTATGSATSSVPPLPRPIAVETGPTATGTAAPASTGAAAPRPQERDPPGGG
jgi:serine/threonine protein kinase